MSTPRRRKSSKKFKKFGGKIKRKGKPVVVPPKKPKQKPAKKPSKKLAPKRQRKRKSKPSYRKLPKRHTKAGYDFNDYEIDEIDPDLIDDVLDNEIDGRRKTLINATLVFEDEGGKVQYRSTKSVRSENRKKLADNLRKFAREYKAYTRGVVITTTTARIKVRREVVSYGKVKRTVFRNSFGRFTKGPK